MGTTGFTQANFDNENGKTFESSIKNDKSQYQMFITQLKSDRTMPPKSIDDVTKMETSYKTLWHYTSRKDAKVANDLLELVSLDYDLNQTRCIDITGLCRKFGIEVYKNNNLPESISGRIYAYGTTADLYEGNSVVIINNGNESFEHRRFVSAHELGHFLFDCCGNAKYDSGDLLFDRSYKHPAKQHTSLEEKRADRFAAQLLMPSNQFRLQYVMAAQSEMGKLLGREYVIDYLAKYFQVKASSIERRLFELLEDGGF